MTKWYDLGSLFTPSEKTKLAGIDAGADVTADNPPQAHGASVHTDRTRKMLISRANMESTGGTNSYGVGLDASTDESAIYNFKLPEDFASLTSAKVVYIPAFSIGLPKTIVFDSLIRFGAVGETFSARSTDTDGTSETINDVNIDTITLPAAAFTNITKDDYIFIEIKRDADNGSDDYGFDWIILGILIEYMADM